MKDLTKQSDIGMLKLNIQKFAGEGEGDQNSQGNNDGNDGAGGNEVVKFGNVAVDLTGLSEEQRASIVQAQNSYVSSVQKISELGKTNSELNSQVEQFNANQNNQNNQQQQNFGNQQQQFVDPNQAYMKDLNQVKLQMANMNIHNFKTAEYQKMVAIKGEAFANDVFAKAEAEFNKNHLDVDSRTPQQFNAYLKYHTGDKMSEPVAGQFNINDPQQFLEMINSPQYKEHINAYQNTQSQQGVPPYMQGNQQGVPNVQNQEQIRQEMAGKSRSERRQIMEKQFGADEQRRRDDAFLYRRR